MRKLTVNQWLVVSFLLHGAAFLALANSFAMPQDDRQIDQVLIVESSFITAQGTPRRRHDNEPGKASHAELKQPPQPAYQERNSSPSKQIQSNKSDISQRVADNVAGPAEVAPVPVAAARVQHAAPDPSPGNHDIGKVAESSAPRAPREKFAEVDDMMFGESGSPHFIHRENPIYPFTARKMGKEGRVLLRLTLDVSGFLKSIEVVEAGGHGFTEAAIKAASRSTFSPARRDGTPVFSRVLLPVRFVLKRGTPD